MNQRRTPGRLAMPLVVVVAVLVLAVAGGTAFAQTAGTPPPSSLPLQENMPRSWYRNFDYRVEVDGKVSADAGLYTLAGKPYMLVYGPSLDSAFVLSVGEPRVVKPVKKDEVTPKSDQEVVLAESAFTTVAPIPWMQDGQTAAIFYSGPRRFRVGRLPPIVGPTTPQEIMDHSPVFRRGADEYQPNADDVAFFKAYPEKVTIEVWFGTWCPHCQVVLPKLMKAMQAAPNPNIEVLYYGLPREFGNYEAAAKKDVRAVPTFIFTKNGKEFGRFRGGAENGTIEDEIVKLLKTVMTAQSG